MKNLNLVFAILFSSIYLSLAHATAIPDNTSDVYMGGQCKILSKTDTRTRSEFVSWNTFTNYSNSAIQVSCPFFHEPGQKTIQKGWVKIVNWNPNSNAACWISRQSTSHPTTTRAVNLDDNSIDQTIQILQFDTLEQITEKNDWNLICSLPPKSAIRAYQFL